MTYRWNRPPLLHHRSEGIPVVTKRGIQKVRKVTKNCLFLPYKQIIATSSCIIP